MLELCLLNTIGNLFSVFAPDIVITYGSEEVSSEGLCELVYNTPQN
jgi:hypothetical protein